MSDDLDYIFIARYSILTASREDGREEMRKALNFIKKTYEKQKKD